MIRRLLAWLRTWGAMESTGRYAWGPDDPAPYDLTPAAHDHLDATAWNELPAEPSAETPHDVVADEYSHVSRTFVDHAITRLEKQFDPARDEDPS